MLAIADTHDDIPAAGKHEPTRLGDHVTRTNLVAVATIVPHAPLVKHDLIVSTLAGRQLDIDESRAFIATEPFDESRLGLGIAGPKCFLDRLYWYSGAPTLLLLGEVGQHLANDALRMSLRRQTQ